MISYLNGKIILKKDKFIVLDVNGVGYKVFLSRATLFKIPKIGENLNPVRGSKSGEKIQNSQASNGVKLFCYLNVSENSLSFYGFLDEKELEFFEILNDIRGIGPKAALEIASVGPLEKLKERILKQDENIFAGIPGIGKKKAMAIILELTGRIKNELTSKKSGNNEVEDALLGLGFSKQRIKEALEKIPKEIIDSQEIIKQAIKILGQ